MPFGHADTAKISGWLEKHKPKCQVCGHAQWKFFPDLVAVPVVGQSGSSMTRALVECSECGYSFLVSAAALGISP
jgi:hypothetical protein